MIFVIVAQRQQMYRYKFKNIQIYLCNDSFRDRITGRETFEMFEVNENVSNSHKCVTWIDSEVVLYPYSWFLWVFGVFGSNYVKIYRFRPNMTGRPPIGNLDTNMNIYIGLRFVT